MLTHNKRMLVAVIVYIACMVAFAPADAKGAIASTRVGVHRERIQKTIHLTYYGMMLQAKQKH